MNVNIIFNVIFSFSPSVPQIPLAQVKKQHECCLPKFAAAL